MTRRVLLVGGDEDARRRIAETLDASFDVDVESQADAMGVLKGLPNRTYDVALVHADGGSLPGLDLVRFLAGHPLHRDVAVLFIGGDEPARKRALELGARRLLSRGAGPEELRTSVREALGLG